MASFDERQLGWVQSNQARPEHSAAIGDLAQQFMKSPAVRGPAWRRRLLAVLEEHLGTAVVEQVQEVRVRHGVLRMAVVEPGVRYELGLRWEQRVLDLIRAHVPEAGIHTVRFVNAR